MAANTRRLRSKRRNPLEEELGRQQRGIFRKGESLTKQCHMEVEGPRVVNFLFPRRHTCYNGRDKGSRSREGELTPKIRPQFGLQAATRLHEAGIATNLLSAIRR
ncbi:hypothetical protein Salat_0857700 [Sesamum alatum]|uniref:Uncharacterized protein n=1 Tax=Sesamum alatum TaxID=300844 RepID=A0AAE1YIX9_9LAMI|nr:hypothetical protein Salat_0857700 [Sesamum alatum]